MSHFVDPIFINAKNTSEGGFADACDPDPADPADPAHQHIQKSFAVGWNLSTRTLTSNGVAAGSSLMNCFHLLNVPPTIVSKQVCLYGQKAKQQTVPTQHRLFLLRSQVSSGLLQTAQTWANAGVCGGLCACAVGGTFD